LPLAIPLTGVGVQSHLQIAPTTLSFGSIALGAPAILSLTLTNTGIAPITGISTAVVPTTDYAITIPCPTATLTAGASCPITVTFTPSALGARPGSLTILSSDASSPDTVPLTGTGIANGSFTLTVNGAATASATVASGTGNPATYTLTVTPVNSFSGTVVLSCTAVVPAQYASCSLLPSSVTLSGGAQTAIATINTVTSIATNTPPIPPHRRFNDTALSLLFPALILTWKARTSRHRAWRRIGPIAWACITAIALLSSSGCGGGGATTNNANPNLRYAASGAYQYQVTASSVSGSTQITQTVTLNLTIQ
jgi:trimeric autotransporter adhesin